LAVVEPTEYHYTRISHRYESNQDPISPCCKVCGERGFSRLHVPKPADPQPVTRHVFVPHEPATGAATSHCQYGDGPTFCGKPASDPCHLQETLLDRIRAGKPLERSPELRAMAQRVVEVAATVGATDVEEWARALAEDVADAND
jgi:predicted  nucleic acid-binding Zn-ribbon protein